MFPSTQSIHVRLHYIGGTAGGEKQHTGTRSTLLSFLVFRETDTHTQTHIQKYGEIYSTCMVVGLPFFFLTFFLV